MAAVAGIDDDAVDLEAESADERAIAVGGGRGFVDLGDIGVGFAFFVDSAAVLISALRIRRSACSVGWRWRFPPGFVARSASGLGQGLAFVFGRLIFAFVAAASARIWSPVFFTASLSTGSLPESDFAFVFWAVSGRLVSLWVVSASDFFAGGLGFSGGFGFGDFGLVRRGFR